MVTKVIVTQNENKTTLVNKGIIFRDGGWDVQKFNTFLQDFDRTAAIIQQKEVWFAIIVRECRAPRTV